MFPARFARGNKLFPLATTRKNFSRALRAREFTFSSLRKTTRKNSFPRASRAGILCNCFCIVFASEHNTKTITQYQALVKNYIRERSERKIFQGFLQVHLTKKSDLGQKSPKSTHRQFVSEFEKLSPKSSKFQAFTSFAPDRSNTKPEKNPPPITSLSYYFSISDKSAKFPKNSQKIHFC